LRNSDFRHTARYSPHRIDRGAASFLEIRIDTAQITFDTMDGMVWDSEPFRVLFAGESMAESNSRDAIQLGLHAGALQ
jgi:hypothetical protein